MNNKKIRAKRTRTKLKKSGRLRLSIFVSNKHMTAQIINDTENKTLVYATDKEVGSGKNTEIAVSLGELVAKKALEKGIDNVVFDRGNKKYHGKIKALADSSRKHGLNF